VSRDLRDFTRQTQTRLVVGFLLLVFLLGDGLIFIFYGRGAGLLGLACLLGALVLAGLIVLVLAIMDRAVKNRE
jgi:membrane protein implicated in regulation of membrane protease activity